MDKDVVQPVRLQVTFAESLSLERTWKRDRNYGDVLGKVDVAIAVFRGIKSSALKNVSGSAERHSSYCFDAVRITQAPHSIDPSCWMLTLPWSVFHYRGLCHLVEVVVNVTHIAVGLRVGYKSDLFFSQVHVTLLFRRNVYTVEIFIMHIVIKHKSS